MQEESKSKRLDVVLALVFLIPVALVFQQSYTSLSEQGAATGDALSNAAMFPKILAVLLGALAVLQAGTALRRRSVDETFQFTVTLRNSLIVIGYLAVYLLALPRLGYHIMTPVLCLAVLLLLGVRPILALIVACAMSLIVALFFESALNVILPVGIFGLALPF